MKSMLITKLLEPIRRHRARASEQILQRKLASLRHQLIGYLNVALAAASEAQSSRAGLRQKLAEERGQFDLFRAELNAFARAQSAKSLDWSLAQLRPTLVKLQQKLEMELTEQFSKWDLRVPRLLEAWRRWLVDFLQRELAEISRVKKAIFCSPLQQTRTHITRMLSAFHDRLADHVKTALGITLPPHEFSLDVLEPDAPPVHVAYFDSSFTAISWLIPLTLFRRSIEKGLLRKASYELGKNFTRVAAGWRDRTDAVIKELVRQAESVAWQDLSALEQMLDQTASNVPHILEAISKLESFPLNAP